MPRYRTGVARRLGPCCGQGGMGVGRLLGSSGGQGGNGVQGHGAEARSFPRVGFGGFLKTGHRSGSRVPSKPWRSSLEEHVAGSRRLRRCEEKYPKDRHRPKDGHVSFRFCPYGLSSLASRVRGVLVFCERLKISPHQPRAG